MATPKDFVSAATVAQEFRDALDGVTGHGVPIAGTRFEAYRDILDEVGEMSFPRRMVFEEDAQKHALYFEAVSQSRQLVDAMTLLPTVANDGGGRLRRIVQGSALPVELAEDEDPTDDARNVLFELAAAVALVRAGFDVDLPDERGADLRATCGPLKPFLVECKRPQHDGSFTRNIAKARKQLGKKLSAAEQGFVMLGIDRLARLGAKSFDTTRDLEIATETYLEKKWRHFEEASCFPTVTMGGVHLVGSVFVNELGGMLSVSLVRLFLAGPRGAPESEAILETMKRVMEVEAKDRP